MLPNPISWILILAARKKVALKGAGAGVLKDVDLMVKLTEAVVKSTSLPVTVKTRLGWDDSMLNIEEVAERLQDVGIKALAIHGRTRCQMYKGEADWTLIGKVKNNPVFIFLSSAMVISTARKKQWSIKTAMVWTAL